jgi:trk system potassium uptake protein TrkA
MNILILGAGQVGSTLAEHLSKDEANNITLVDISAEKIFALQDKMDIRTEAGLASHPKVLERAGGEDADLVIAVTQSDEVNILACLTAHKMFKTPAKIARIRSKEYLEIETLFRLNSIGETVVDAFISPDMLVVDHIASLLELPGALQVLDFAEGKLRLVAVKAYYGGPLVGHEIAELKKHLPSKAEARIVAIYRNGQPIPPEGTTRINANDEVFFLSTPENIKRVIKELRANDKPYKRIMIAGGGNIGLQLAQRIEENRLVKLIEFDKTRAASIAQELDKTLVLVGDATDQELLHNEGIDEVDVFLALTNSDEANIISSMLAKKLGVNKVMSIVNKTSYVDLVQNDTIDIAISPEQITISSVLSYVRKGDTTAAHSLRRGAAEVMEVVVHEETATAGIIGKTIEELNLHKGVTIGAIIREEEVIIAHHDTRIENEDHVIIFVNDSKEVHSVEKLFGGSN